MDHKRVIYLHLNSRNVDWQKKKLGNQLKLVIFNDSRNYEYGCTSFLATAQVRKQRVDNMCNIVMQICGIGFCIVKGILISLAVHLHCIAR